EHQFVLLLMIIFAGSHARAAKSGDKLAIQHCSAISLENRNSFIAPAAAYGHRIRAVHAGIHVSPAHCRITGRRPFSFERFSRRKGAAYRAMPSARGLVLEVNGIAGVNVVEMRSSSA